MLIKLLKSLIEQAESTAEELTQDRDNSEKAEEYLARAQAFEEAIRAVKEIWQIDWEDKGVHAVPVPNLSGSPTLPIRFFEKPNGDTRLRFEFGFYAPHAGVFIKTDNGGGVLEIESNLK